MLIVNIHNLRIDEQNHAKYEVWVKTSVEPLAWFIIEDFDRSRGWKALLQEAAKKAAEA